MYQHYTHTLQVYTARVHSWSHSSLCQRICWVQSSAVINNVSHNLLWKNVWYRHLPSQTYQHWLPSVCLT